MEKERLENKFLASFPGGEIIPGQPLTEEQKTILEQLGILHLWEYKPLWQRLSLTEQEKTS